MNRTRSLFVIPRYWPAVGGSELHTRELAQRMQPYADIKVLCHNSASGIDNELACAQAETLQQRDNQVQVHQAGTRGIRRHLLQGLAHLYPNARAARPLYDNLFAPVTRNAIHAASQDRELIHAVYNGMTVVAEAAQKVAQARDIPFIWTPLAHTHAPEGTAWSSPRFRRLYQRADALVAMTEYERDWLIRHGARPSRTHVCPVGPLLDDRADPASFRALHAIGQAPIVLFLGRHAETKGYRQLVQATQAIWSQYPNVRFVFAGPQTQASQDFFNQWHDPRIIKIEYLSESDKNSALAACDMLCVPSTQESLGVTYLEAWHYAKPVIGADIDVLRSVIAHGEDGLLTAQTPAGISAAINTLLADADLRHRMGKAGQAKSRDRYDWNRLAADMANLYATTLGHKSGQQEMI